MIDKKIYTLTKEHKDQLKSWADKWIANTMSTKPMDDFDKKKMIEAVHGMYDSAKLNRPKHIVFVPSPMVLRLAGGFASWIWYLKNKKNKEATRDATADATYNATADATADAIRVATREATYDATYNTTADATRVATSDATYAVTLDAIRDATYDTTAVATDEATVTKKNKNWFSISSDSILQIAKSIFKPEHVTYAIQCASRSWYMWVGGNQWSSWVAFLSFFRHVVKLDLNEYEKFKFYEDACIHGGPRIMHQDFCMISDRPEILLVDEQNRPHCDTGPFCKWRDGFSLYAVHGVRVPQYVVETPALIEIKDIENENNLEVKRVMIDRYGSDRYMQDSGAQLVQSDRYGELYVKPIQGDETITMVKVINSTPEPDGTNKIYWLRVPPNTPTAHAGVAWSFGLDVDQYNPMKET